MSHTNTTRLRPAAEPRPDARKKPAAARRSRLGPWILFLLVFAVQLTFGIWMNARGFLWGDAISRAESALLVLYSTDPHLGAVGFTWMPLPTFIEMLWVTVYPLWPGIVSSGFASTLTSALAGGTTAALLLATSQVIGLRGWFGWAFVLLVSFNPMLFLYATNGMSEGVAAPFLTGAVASLTLFWHSGRRRYVLVSGLALALAFACLYQAVHYGAFLFAALVLSLLWRSENRSSAPQGRWRSVEGLGLLFLVPSVYVALLWVGANAVIMGDPLYFTTSQYSNAQVVEVSGTVSDTYKAVLALAGDLPSTMLFVMLRTAPFLIPGLFLLIIRAADGRLLRVNTLSLLLLLVMPSFAFNVPVIFEGTSHGWLRYFMYPLFVAAGWGLYEVCLSEKTRRAQGFVLAGWVLAAPVILWAMLNPDFGRQENQQMRALFSGESFEQTEYHNLVGETAPVAVYLNKKIFPQGESVLLDNTEGWTVALQVSPKALRNQLITTQDRDFADALAKPDRYSVRYLLVAEPERVPQDAITREYPKLWSGEDPAFKLVERFPRENDEWRVEWRLYEFLPPGTEAFDRNLGRITDEDPARKEGRAGGPHSHSTGEAVPPAERAADAR